MSRSDEGFVINEIGLKGFMRYRDPARVRFQNKFTVITGPTGSGKTSLMDAVTFSLYGSSSRTDEKMKIDEFLDKNGYVKLGFGRGGQDYEVARGRKNGKSYLTLVRGNERIPGSTVDLEYKIRNLVGLDYIGFRNSTFIRQDEMKEIGSESGSERVKIFERLFRLEKFERAQEIADRKFHAADREVVKTEQEIQQRHTEYSETLPSEQRKLEEVERNYSSLEKRLRELETKTSEVDQATKKLEPSHKKYEEATEGIEAASEEIRRCKKDLDKAVKENHQRAELKKTVDQLFGYPQQRNKLDREQQNLEKKQDSHNHLLERRREHVNARNRTQEKAARGIREAQSELREQQGRLKKLAKSLTKEEAFDLLRQEGGLTERIERIVKEIGWLKDVMPTSFLQSLTVEQREAETQILRVAARTKRITRDIFIKAEIEDEIKRFQDRLRKLEKQATEEVGSEEAYIKKIDVELARIDFGVKDTARLRQVKTLIDEIQKRTHEYDSARKRLEKLSDQGPLMANLKTNLRRLGKKLQSHTQREKMLAQDEGTYSAVLEQKKSIEKDFGNVQRKLGDAEGQKKVLERRVEELEKLGPQIKKLKDELDELEGQKEVFKVLKQDVFHRKGILLYAINQLLLGIGIEASKILGEITDQRLNKIRLTPNPEVRGGSIKIDVEGVDGLFHDVSVFSGGEKTQVNAALRFAISKELARMPQIGKSYGNMKTLFIDEGDLGSLDTESARSLFVKKLLSMGDLFERIILITHIIEVAEQFPSRIQVYMTPEKYSRVEVGGIRP